MKIAIMGGTFNPIHNAHLLSAEQVRDGLGFDTMLFIPSARPPHKDHRDIIDPEHRYQMTVLATKAHPHFEVSRIELDRVGPSYAIQTVKELQAFYGTGCELAFVIGADSLIDFKIWKNFDEILNLCQFIATTRPNYSFDRVPPDLRDRVVFFPVTAFDVSSTEIRRRIRAGKSIRYLVPQAVAAYIEGRQLYR